MYDILVMLPDCYVAVISVEIKLELVKAVRVQRQHNLNIFWLPVTNGAKVILMSHVNIHMPHAYEQITYIILSWL